MTKLLDRAMIAAQALSPEAQDEVARVVLTMATGEETVYALTPEERDSLTGSRAQIAPRRIRH